MNKYIREGAVCVCEKDGYFVSCWISPHHQETGIKLKWNLEHIFACLTIYSETLYLLLLSRQFSCFWHNSNKF